MTKLKLRFACAGYDRMEPLRDGTVSVEGIDLENIVCDTPREIFDRMADGDEIDIGEFSTSQFIRDMVEGNGKFVAIPVFASRVFRHGYIFVNRKSGIETPCDLAGKRIGLGLYTQTACVWIRGHLRDHYGVDLSTVRWIEGAAETPGPHGETPSAMPADIHVDIRQNESGRSLSDLLSEGELDAYFGAKTPSCFGRNPDIQRLFRDYRSVEKQFYRQTGIYPIMHLVAIRKSVYDSHPWIAKPLLSAFSQAKDIAVKRMRMSAAPRYMLPWLVSDLEEMDELFGPDPWPYGVEENRRTIDALVGHLADEGLIRKRPRAENLFVGI